MPGIAHWLTSGEVAPAGEDTLNRRVVANRRRHTETADAVRRVRVLERLLAIDAVDLRRALTEVADLLADALTSEKVDVFLKETNADALVALYLDVSRAD